MQHRKDRKSARYHFNSLSEMGEYIARERKVWRQSSSRSNRASRSWDLNTDYDGAVELARNGWIEGAQRAQDALKVFPNKTPEPDTRTDFYGFRPHVPRFCAGALDSMIRHVPHAETGAGRVLTLIVPVVANASARAECMANFGVAIAQYINQLETDGTRVEVIAAITVNGMGCRFTTSWHVKYADQPLDLAALTFTIGHPAMLRRVWFAFAERQTGAPEMNGYGSACDSTTDDVINAPLGAYVLNGMTMVNQCAPTPEQALEYVTQKIDAAIAAQELQP